MINENLENRKLNDFFKTKEKLGGKPDLKHKFPFFPPLQYIYKELLNLLIENQNYLYP